MKRRSAIPAAAILMALAAPCLAQTAPQPGIRPPQLLQIPPPARPPAYVPFAGLPAVELDEANNRVGVGQAVARERQLQGRVLWIDAVANLERINTAEKIQALVRQIRAAGFNTVVLDVKPIVGHTLYPSRFAPRLLEWNKSKLPATLDPVALFVKAGQAAGLGVLANLNVFSEGNRAVSAGPAYQRSEWQTTVCEPQLVLVDRDKKSRILVTPTPNGRPETVEEVTLYTDAGALAPSEDAAIAFVDATRRVLRLATGGEVAAGLAIPKGGAVLVGEDHAADFMRRALTAGAPLPLETTSRFVPILQSRVSGVPVWTNPHHPEVQQRVLDMIAELLGKYPLDGIVFDDRLRYAGVLADCSEPTRKAFEQYVGRALTWPDDILAYDISFPAMVVRVTPGPYMDTWLLWRALNIRNWVARAAAVVKSTRPSATVGVYVGSWYGEYPALGSNWAAPDFMAGFRFLTDAYRQTGFAGLVDWVTPGCYYSTATVAQAARLSYPVGQTVEAAGQLANRAVNNQAWVYAGISLDKFDRNPEALGRALQAACASTQGVMVFDLSHKMDQFWPIFRKAFSKPARAPHAVPGLLAEVRKKHAERKAAGAIDPPVIIQNGASGTGL